MDISSSAFEEFTELEILAHCLFEMTFVSFDEDKIKNKLEELNKTVKEFEDMTDEEQK